MRSKYESHFGKKAPEPQKRCKLVHKFWREALNTGLIEVYSGDKPASPNDAPTGTLLARILSFMPRKSKEIKAVKPKSRSL